MATGEQPSRVQKARNAVDQQAAQSQERQGNLHFTKKTAGRRRNRNIEGETDHTHRDRTADIMNMTEEELAERDLQDALRENEQNL